MDLGIGGQHRAEENKGNKQQVLSSRLGWPSAD